MKIRVVTGSGAGIPEEAIAPSSLSLLQPAAPSGLSGRLFGQDTVSHEALKTAARLRLALGPSGRMVGIAGISENDGPPLLAARLGTALASMDQSQVLVIEGDDHSPALEEIFSVPRIPGFLDLLDSRADLKLAARPVTPGNLFVLPAGESERSLASLLTSPTCTEIMAIIRHQFRYIVVDIGVMHEGASGVLLASMCDGVVAALAAGDRRRREVLDFRRELERMKIPLLGVVLTRGASA